MTIDQLHCAPVMEREASALQQAHPTVQFLSGRRDIPAQAHAMACQVVTNKQWIHKTYLHAAALQTAIDFYTGTWTVDAIADALADVMYGMSTVELDAISDHFDGHAVDILPMEFADGLLTPEGQAVVAWIHDCPSTKKLLTREGGKIIWHWACKPEVTV